MNHPNLPKENPMKIEKSNPIFQIIHSRRAVRKYKNATVKKEIIAQIIEAGKMAPSALNRQPWKFYIIADEKLIKQYSHETIRASQKAIISSGLKNLSKNIGDILHFPDKINFMKTEDPIFHHAPVVIFITADKENEWASIDIGMCAQNMMLAAKALGVDTCPIGFVKYLNETKTPSSIGIPENEILILAISLGYGDEDPLVKSRQKDNVKYIHS